MEHSFARCLSHIGLYARMCVAVNLIISYEYTMTHFRFGNAKRPLYKCRKPFLVLKDSNFQKSTMYVLECGKCSKVFFVWDISLQGSLAYFHSTFLNGLSRSAFSRFLRTIENKYVKRLLCTKILTTIEERYLSNSIFKKIYCLALYSYIIKYKLF